MKSAVDLDAVCQDCGAARQGGSEHHARQRHPDHQPREETGEADAKVEHDARARAPIDRVRPVVVPDDHRDTLEEEARLVPAEPDDLFPGPAPARSVSSYPMAHRWPVVSIGSLLVLDRGRPGAPGPTITERCPGHYSATDPTAASGADRRPWNDPGAACVPYLRDDLDPPRGTNAREVPRRLGPRFCGNRRCPVAPEPDPRPVIRASISGGTRSRRGAARRHLETQRGRPCGRGVARPDGNLPVAMAARYDPSDSTADRPLRPRRSA